MKACHYPALSPHQLEEMFYCVLLRQTNIIKQIEMNYGPLYYPYYSARIDLPPSLSELEKRIALQQQESIRNLAEQQYLIRTNGQLANLSLEANVQLQSSARNRMFQAEVIKAVSRRRQADEQLNHLARMEELRRKQDILINRDRSAHYLDQREMSDDQLVNYYENGFRVEQYQRELRERLGSLKNTRDQIREPDYKPLLGVSKRDQNIDSVRGKETGRDRSMQSIVGRSYVDELKSSSKWDRTIDTQLQRNQNATIQPQTDDKIKVSNYYPLNYSLKKGKKAGTGKKYSKSANKHSTRNNKSCKVSFTSGNLLQPNSVSFSDFTIHSALKKISNRLKVSAIVYKDSKLRNAVHEMNHLVQTFEVQKKGRKQIRDKVNNHPSILKKHRLVAESR